MTCLRYGIQAGDTSFPVQAVRPKLTPFKTFEEAAFAVDEMFSVVIQDAGGMFLHV